MKKNKLNVAVIGTGFGLDTHVPAINQSDYTNLYTIFSRNEKKNNFLNSKFKTQKKFKNYDLLLSDEKIDLILISLPPEFHFSFSKKAIEKGKNIFCEKPFTLNSEEALSLSKLAKKHKVKGFVGYQMRFQPTRIAIKNFLSGSDFGNVIETSLRYDFASRIQSKPNWNWWSLSSKGGGVLNAIGSHQIDLLSWWLGEPSTVTGILKNHNDKLIDASGKSKKVETDEIFSAIFEYDNGSISSLKVSSLALGWKTSYAEIYGEKASLFLKGEQNLEIFRNTTAKHDVSKVDENLAFPWVSGSIWRAAFFRQLESICKNILFNIDTHAADLTDGYKVHEIMKGLRKSSSSGNRQSLSFKV